MCFSNSSFPFIWHKKNEPVYMCEANTALILEDELHHSLLHIVHLPKPFGGYWLFTLRESITCLSGMEKNFRMQDGETFSLPYDATSIMHYGRYSTQNDKCITNSFSVKVMWYFKVITLVSGIFFQRPACPPSSQRKMWRKWDREINWQRLTLKGFDVSTAVVYSQLCSLHINFICGLHILKL